MTYDSRNILVVVDPHKSSHDILLRARQLASKEDVALHLIHIVSRAHSTGLRYRLSKDRRDLQRLAKLYDLPAATIKVRVGYVNEVLREEAGLLNAEVMTARQQKKRGISLLSRGQLSAASV